MKTLSRFQLALAATVIALFALPFAAYALVSYPAGSLLQPNDVATSTIRAYAISPAKIASGLDFTMHGLTTTNSTSTNATTTTLAVTGSTLALNGVVYTTPSADGTSGQVLTTNGAKTLSFNTPTASKTFSTFTTFGAISKGNAVRITNNSIGADATSSGSIGAGVSTLTYPLTTSGTNRVLVVHLYNQAQGVNFTATYAGISMTRVQQTNGYYSNESASFVLINPAIGTNNVVVTRDTTTGGMYSGAISYVGASQATQPDTSTATYGTGATTVTCGDTSVTDNTWSSMIAYAATYAVSAGTNSTLLFPLAGYSSIFVPTNGNPSSPAGSVSMTANIANADYVGCSEVTVRPLSTLGVISADALTSVDSSSFIGFAEAAYATSTTATIDTSGVTSLFSGLTGGTQYYLSNTPGAISTSAGTVPRKVGISTNSTDMLITNIW